MTRYYKHKEAPEVAQHMKFYDQYGNELHHVIELDTAQDNGEPNGKRINANGAVEDCYYKYAYAVVDGIADPTEEHLHAFRQLHKVRHFNLLPQHQRHAMLAEALQLKPKPIDAICPNCKHQFKVEQ
jgi:hypothetical protein